MKLEKIRDLLRGAIIADVSRKTGLSIRSLYYIRDGQNNITLATFDKLDAWARRHKPAAEAREAAQ